MKKQLLTIGLMVAVQVSLFAKEHQSVSLEPIGNYRTGIFGEGASEIVAFDSWTKRLFSVNGYNHTIDVLSLKDPSNPTFLFAIDLTEYGKAANSVAVQRGILAAAIENEDKQAPGKVCLFATWGKCHLLKKYTVGALPDMVTFSPDGRFILTANEGEPSDDYSNDPEGSVSIIDLSRGIYRSTVATAVFTPFNERKEELIAEGVRIYGPNATVAQDLEPEYIAVSGDSKTAWVTLQENNAIAIISLYNATVDSIIPLGYKDHLDIANKLDVSNKDGVLYLNNWPVYGMYQPDAIAAFTIGREQFLVTANEGDARAYDGFSEEERVKKIKLDPIVFPFAEDLQKDKNLGRLTITTSLGDIDGDGDFDKIYCYGGRSFSILSGSGELIYESGSLLEEITAELLPDDFNSTDDENGTFDNRSDDKGPEPEGVTVGKIGCRTYAFIGLERIGGIMTFDVSNPYEPQFVDYVNTRDFSGDPEADSAGDLAPEGLTFVSAIESPTRKPLLIASFEISGSIAVFEIKSEGGHNHGRRCSPHLHKHAGHCR